MLALNFVRESAATLRPRRLRSAASLPLATLLLALSACQGPSHLARQREPGPRVLPALDGAYFLLEEGSLKRRSSDAERQVIVADIGRPVTGAADLYGEWGCGAYERGLAFFHLASEQVVLLPRDTAPYDEVFVQGALAACLRGTQLEVLSIPSGEVVLREDMAAWLEAHDVKQIDAVLPLEPGRLLVACSRPVAVRPASTLVQWIDTSTGSWSILASQEMPEFTQVQASASDGGYLYLAGFKQDSQLVGVGPQQSLQSTLVVQRLDLLEGRDRQTVLFQPLQESGFTIARLAVGANALAIQLDRGDFSIWEVQDGAARPRAAYENAFPVVDSLAWIDATTFAVTEPGGVRKIRWGR